MSGTIAYGDLIPSGNTGRIFRHKLIKLNHYCVTKQDIEARLKTVIQNVNLVEGPKVIYDEERKCYGLQADRNYNKGETVTTYGGRVLFDPLDQRRGDYMAKVGKDGTVIDGAYNFKLTQKGRWINESDNKRTIINVEISRYYVTATRPIAKDEWIFADYGKEYERSY